MQDIAGRVLARFLVAGVLAPNSAKAKPGTRVVVPGRGRFVVEPPDGDDTFPPAIESFEVVDGWVVYRATNGGEGVIGAPQRKLDEWARDVEKFKAQRPKASNETPWTEADGGKANVAQAIDAAEAMFRKGGVRADVRVWVHPGKQPQGSAAGDTLNLVNVHQGGTVQYIGGASLPLPAQVGAHEAAHIVFAHSRSKAEQVLDTLKERERAGEDSLTAYHSLAGHFEGVMEAAAFYLLAPGRMKQIVPDVFEAVKEWLD